MVVLLIAILPVIIIALYIYHKDNEKESKKLLIKLLLYGMLSCIPAVLIEIYISRFFPEEETMNLVMKFIYSFLGVALIEELCKWYFVYRKAYHNKEFDHIYDAIVYSTYVALGFALFENLFYVLQGGITIGLLRAITAVPGHAIDGIIMGEYLGLAKKYELVGNQKLSTLAKFMSVFVPTFTHTLYDFCLLTGKLLFLGIFIVFLISLYRYSFKTIKRLSRVSSNLYTHNNLS